MNISESINEQLDVLNDLTPEQLASLPRAERRRIEKEQAKKGKATYNITAEQLRQIKIDAYKYEAEQFAKVREAMINTAINVILNASCIVLADEYGFGQKRLQKYSDRMMAQMECITGGYVTLEEMQAEREKLEKRSKVSVEMI